MSQIKNNCGDCGKQCDSHSECLINQKMNIIMEDAKAIAKVKKHIKNIVPSFTGKKTWLKNNVDHEYETYNFEDLKNGKINEHLEFDQMIYIGYRFMTVTFDPRKFSANELSQPIKLINYFRNVLKEVKTLLKRRPIIIIEYHKSGIPHFHINYDVEGVLELNSLILRMKYYFSKDLRTKSTIHDRVMNQYGLNYMQKSNETFFTYKNI